MADRPLTIASASQAIAATNDSQTLGNGDLFALNLKVTSELPSRMFSVKCCESANIWQFSFMERNLATGVRSVAEAIVAVPHGEDLQRVNEPISFSEYPIVVDMNMVVDESTGRLATPAVSTRAKPIYMRCMSRFFSPRLGVEKATYFIPAAVESVVCGSKGVWLVISRERGADAGAWECAVAATWCS
jgi:hypothetical protein